MLSHVLSHHRHQLLIVTGQVVVQPMPNILSLNQTNMSVTSCLTPRILYHHQHWLWPSRLLYKSEDVFNAFNDYAKQITKGLFVYGEDAELRKITANAPIYYYGFDAEGNDFVASDLLRSTTGSDLHRSFSWSELGQFHSNLWSSNIRMDSCYWSFTQLAWFELVVNTWKLLRC